MSVKCIRCAGSGDVTCDSVYHCGDPDDGYVTCPDCDGEGEIQVYPVEQIRPFVKDLSNTIKALAINEQEFIYLRSILEARVEHPSPHWMIEVTCACPCGCHIRFEDCSCELPICGICWDHFCRDGQSHCGKCGQAFVYTRNMRAVIQAKDGVFEHKVCPTP